MTPSFIHLRLHSEVLPPTSPRSTAKRGSPQIVTQFDKDDVEAVGLVKFDFLGLRTLTIVDWALHTIKETRAKKDEPPVVIEQIPMNDEASFRLLKDCETTAVLHQEQVIQIAQVLAGYTLGGADLLRRAMGTKKPEEMAGAVASPVLALPEGSLLACRNEDALPRRLHALPSHRRPAAASHPPRNRRGTADPAPHIETGRYRSAISPVHFKEVAAITEPGERLEMLGLLTSMDTGNVDCDLQKAQERALLLRENGIAIADSAHVAFAEQLADCFITCDDTTEAVSQDRFENFRDEPC